ncbi:MAG: polyamine aminopropyltransferase [Bacteriodetes bacterium]|nr:polyamine aminopropyltransferase [Bacteroidota bacterium]
MQLLLLLSVSIIATCGLVYELAAGTLASYLLGDSVTQFSTIIGAYLFCMGIGSYLSRFIKQNLLDVFIQTEILVGIVGGTSSALLFILFPHIDSFRIVLYLIVSCTGILVGLEIPLLMNILKKQIEFQNLISRVFSYDYAGALLASIIFPLVMVPYLGLVRTSFFFGCMNVSVALVLCYVVRNELRFVRSLALQSIIVFLFLFMGILYSDSITNLAETDALGENIIYSVSSPYQRIILTRSNKAFKLYLNGNLQFNTNDEYRYHESLVHPLMCLYPSNPKHVLVLGGGDGLAAREILKYPSVKDITLVDLDYYMTNLFSTNPLLAKLNKKSLQSNHVKIVNDDAFVWLRSHIGKYDIIIVDFPDPSNYSVGKLYTDMFYRTMKKVTHDSTIVVVQSTSPLVAPKSFWCVNATLQSAGFNTKPYHTFIPSFGEWGYILASPSAIPDLFHSERLPDSLLYFTPTIFQQMLNFAPDMKTNTVNINKLNNQILVQYFEQEWSEYLH